MNKAQLVAAVADATNKTKKEAAEVLEAVLETVTAALKRGDKVTLTGFGTFEVRNRAARPGRNPQTGETIQIPATKVPAFKAGKALKDAVK
jgi:DNA-binding protein HU-beta